MSPDDILVWLSSAGRWLTASILFVSAFTEYIFPPYPGDMVTIAGAVLVGGYGLPFWDVFLSVTLGGLLGATCDFYVGRLLALRDIPGIKKYRGYQTIKDKAMLASSKMARNGWVYILLNRFLPGIRPFILVAAGMGGMDVKMVMFFAFISSVLWNSLLLFGGYMVGKNLELLVEIFKSYQMVVWLALCALALIFVMRKLLRGSSKK